MRNASSSPAARKRRWPWIVGGIAVLFLLIALIAPMFINVDKYRPEIASAISNATGRQVTLGAIHARLLPSVAVVVDGFQLGNPKGFAAGNLISVEQIRGGLTLTALLHGDIHVTSIKLVNPKLALMEDENGQTNYTFPAEIGASGGAPAPGAAKSSSFSMDAIDSIELEGAEVSLEKIPARGAKPFPTITAHKVGVTMENVLLDANAIKQWRANSRLKGVSVEVGALAVPVTFDSGEVHLANGVLDGNFQVHAGKIADIKGTLRVDDVTHAVTNFELSTPVLDADALLAAIRATPETHHSGAVAAAPVPSTNELLAHGKLSATRVSWSPYEAENATAQISVYANETQALDTVMTLYGGALKLGVRTDARQDPARFSANLALDGLDLGRMLLVTTGGMKGKMTGTAAVHLNMAGPTGGVWQKSLTGKGDFSILDGKLPGVNLGGALGVLAKAAGVNETSFKRIGGDLSANDGRVSTSRTTMDSSAGMVELAGGFSLIDQSMSFDGKATITPSGAVGVAADLVTGLLGVATNKQITSITVPFSIGGTLSNPRFAPGKGIPSFGGSPSGNAPPSKSDALSKGLSKILGKHH